MTRHAVARNKLVEEDVPVVRQIRLVQVHGQQAGERVTCHHQAGKGGGGSQSIKTIINNEYHMKINDTKIKKNKKKNNT